jgi:hypothetical protein
MGDYFGNIAWEAVDEPRQTIGTRARARLVALFLWQHPQPVGYFEVRFIAMWAPPGDQASKADVWTIVCARRSGQASGVRRARGQRDQAVRGDMARHRDTGTGWDRFGMLGVVAMTLRTDQPPVRQPSVALLDEERRALRFAHLARDEPESNSPR